jgi:hypothetical protein
MNASSNEERITSFAPAANLRPALAAALTSLPPDRAHAGRTELDGSKIPPQPQRAATVFHWG